MFLDPLSLPPPPPPPFNDKGTNIKLVWIHSNKYQISRDLSLEWGPWLTVLYNVLSEHMSNLFWYVVVELQLKKLLTQNDGKSELMHGINA